MSKLKVLLGRRIREIRRAKNLTQERLSELTGIGVSSLSKIENGIYHPSDNNLEKIARVLGVEPYELYMYKHNKDLEALKNDINYRLNNATEEEIRIVYKVLCV